MNKKTQLSPYLFIQCNFGSIHFIIYQILVSHTVVIINIAVPVWYHIRNTALFVPIHRVALAVQATVVLVILCDNSTAPMVLTISVWEKWKKERKKASGYFIVLCCLLFFWFLVSITSGNKSWGITKRKNFKV